MCVSVCLHAYMLACVCVCVSDAIHQLADLSLKPMATEETQTRHKVVNVCNKPHLAMHLSFLHVILLQYVIQDPHNKQALCHLNHCLTKE